jgi:hypothetical protein
MSDVCIFCGYEGDDFVPEHWIPDWLSRKLLPKHGSMVGHVIPDGSIVKRRYFVYTVDHVCKTKCNGGWMSDMESRASDDGDVLRLILGVPKPPLSQEAQARLAAWCFLKAITVELARPGDIGPPHYPATYPQAMYTAFRQERKPPTPNCSIALGFRTINTITEPDPLFVWSKSQGRNFPAGDPGGIGSEAGYHTTLVIGHLVIDVAGLVRPINTKVDHGDERLVPLWPELPGGAFPWPPPKRFSGIANDDLI